VEAGRYKDALHTFSEAATDGMRSQNTVYLLAYAAQRKFSDTATVLARSKSASIPSMDIGNANVRSAIAVDQGNWKYANGVLEAARTQAQALGHRFVGRFEGTILSLNALDGTPTITQVSALKDYLAQEVKALGVAAPTDIPDLKFQITFTAYLAAYVGDTTLANQALGAVDPESDADTPVLNNMHGVAQAEIERASGKPQAALTILKPLANGSELYITHVALMSAYADAKDNSSALTEARWLSSHRGRAYAESNMHLMLAPFNVAWSDLALLNAAEFSKALGKNTEARESLAALKNVWPTANEISWLAPRLKKFGSKL